MWQYLRPAADDAMWMLYAMLGVAGAVAMTALGADGKFKLRIEHVIVAAVCAVLTCGWFEIHGEKAGKLRSKQRRYMFALLAGLGWQGLMPAASSAVARMVAAAFGS